MWKLAFLLLLALCLHVSLAGKKWRTRMRNQLKKTKGSKQDAGKWGVGKWGAGKWGVGKWGAGKRGAGKWGREGHEEHGHAGHGQEGGYSKYGKKKGFDYSNMDGEEMMMMRMRKMMVPMRNVFTKVLALGPEKYIPGQPRFCGENECPKYNVTYKSEHFELRCYEPTKWASTEMEARNPKMASKMMFWRLFAYIQGKNDRKKKIKMTVPVPKIVTPSLFSNETKIYNMSFYIPQAHQANPPAPLDSTVKVVTTPRTCYYVHPFEGSTFGVKSFLKHARMLKKALDNDNLQGTYVPPEDMFVTAGYDDPLKMFDRHNEVWLMKKSA